MNIQEKELQVLLDSIERQACRDSFYEFFLSFWNVIIEENLSDNWHIKYLCEELQKLTGPIVKREEKLYDMIINIPPGTTKSTITTIMYPAWLWTQDPSLRIITNSYSSDLAVEHAIKARDIITSEKYNRLFPEVKLRGDKAGKEAYENTRRGARYTTSTGGTITGKHAHVIINDDPLNPKQAASKVKRTEANEHTKTLSSRKVDKRNTPVITIMQRLAPLDTTGYLLKKQNVKHICLPCRTSKHIKPPHLRYKYKNGLLDPTRLSEKVLKESHEDLGSRQFAGQFDQTPTEEGGAIFKEHWFPICTFFDFASRRTGQPIVFFLDTAYTEKQENDPSGIIATCKIGNTLYILNAAKVRLGFPDLIKWLPVYARRHGYAGSSSIRIEPKASGISVIQQLQRYTNLNVVRTKAPSESKETRANAASPFVESERVVLVEGDWNTDFVEEVCGFPRADHDEYVDILGYSIDFHLKGTTINLEEQKRRANML